MTFGAALDAFIPQMSPFDNDAGPTSICSDKCSAYFPSLAVVEMPLRSIPH